MSEQRIDKVIFSTATFSFVLQFVSQAIHLIIGIILVRLLLPEDFGIWGILIVFWNIAWILLWGGLGTALVQKTNVSNLELNSVFYYNVFFSLICVLAGYLIAPTTASFFHLPILENLLPVLMLTAPLAGICDIQVVLLTRQLKLHIVSMCTFLGYLFSIPFTLWLAWHKYGVWALVWQMIIAQAITAMITFVFCRWLPSLCFSFVAIKNLFKFGISILLAGLLDSVFSNIYNLVIGKFYPITILGYYERGRGYAALWPMSVQGTISSVLFPAFSKIQDDVPRLRNAVVESLKMSVFIVFFPSLLIAALAVPFVTIVLSEKWLPIVPYYQALTLSFVWIPLHYLNLNILNARGRSGLYLGLVSLNKLFIVVNILCTVWFSVMAMVWGMVVVSLVSLYFNTRYTKRVLNYGLRAQIKDSLPYLLYSLIASGTAYGLYLLLWPVNHWLGLFVPMAAGCVIYLLLNVFCYSPAFDTAWRLGKEQLRGWLKKEERSSEAGR